MREIRNVTIVGAGTMGHMLAQVFAQGGCNVWLNDVSADALARARKQISSSLETLIEMQVVERNQKEAVLGRIQTTVSLDDAGGEADFVTEAITEDAAAKKALFRQLDKICRPAAILASNTSFLDIFKIVETERPDRVLITHWFAPPHIVPLVEIVRGPRTSQQSVDTIRDLMLRLGKSPIVMTRFLPGFIGNRLQAALGNEVMHLLDNGYATAEDIDTAAKNSFGLRMPVLGLVKRMDFTGLDLTQKLLSNANYEIPPRPTRSRSVDALVASGKLGVKTGSGFYDYGGRSTEEILKERDIKMIRLREFLRSMGEL